MQEQKLTGYPSIDKPWLKYYSEEAINAPLPECSMYEYICENNKDHLDDTALIFFNRKITFGEMFEQIDRLARAFVAAGVKKNDVVPLMMLNQPETVYCLYALNKIGAVGTVVNVLSSAREIETYLNESDSKVFVVLDVFYEKCFEAAKKRGIEKMICVSLFNSRDIVSKIGYRLKVKSPDYSDKLVTSWKEFVKNENHVPALPNVEKDPSKVALISHTGGTTGFPKGVLLSDNIFNSIAFQCSLFFDYKRQDKLLALIVPHATYGISVNLHLPLALGLTVVLIPKVDPEHVDDLIINYKPNFVPSIPLYWASVVDSNRIKDLSFLKWASAGGSGVSSELISKFNELAKSGNSNTQLLEGYGMTEVGALASVQMKGHVISGSVGFPLPRNTISAFDTETLEEKKYGEIGEICISGPSVMISYLDNEEETSKVLKKHDDGQIWMHTGDFGYVDESGNVFIQGRIKRIYLTMFNGLHSKIFPDRIEQTLIKHPAVSECGVVCVAKEKNIYRPVAFCVINESASLDESAIEKELRSLATKELPEYSIPEIIVFKTELPHTSHGKIDYIDLEKEANKKEL